MSRPALEVIEGGRTPARAWLEGLYRRYGGAVHGRCRYLLKDEAAAEDATHDVFARALTSQGSFRGEASPLTWLMQIATHHCLNLLRAKAAPWRAEFIRLELSRDGAHGGPQAMEDRDSVRRSLAEFDLETQRAAVHYFVDEMTLEEVAELIDRSVPTVRKRLRAFAARCGEALREDPRWEKP